jgi:hypothetical protein
MRRVALGARKKRRKKKPNPLLKAVCTTDDGAYQLGKIFIIIATAIYFSVLSCFFTLQWKEKKKMRSKEKKIKYYKNVM